MIQNKVYVSNPPFQRASIKKAKTLVDIYNFLREKGKPDKGRKNKSASPYRPRKNSSQSIAKEKQPPTARSRKSS